jgi:hypothetical protein
MQSTGASFPCSFLSGATIPHFPKGLGTNLVFDRRRLERNPALVADLTFTGRAGLNREKPRFSMFSSRQTPSLPNGEPSQTGINVAFDSDIRGIAREKPRFIGKKPRFSPPRESGFERDKPRFRKQKRGLSQLSMERTLMNVSYWIGMPFHTNNGCARSLLEALAGFLLKSFKRELT